MSSPPTSPWLVLPRPDPEARLRLFCFPYAGGGAPVFHAWPDDLPEGVEVCAVQLPGRGTRIREAAFTRAGPLVRELEAALRSDLDRPFACFGHSLGGLLAYLFVREINRLHDLQPVHLFVSGCSAPQLPNPNPPVHALPERVFIAELAAMGGTPDQLLDNAELMDLMSPTLRADFAIYESYTYEDEPPLDCPLTAFGGSEDGRVSHAELDAWREQTNGPFASHVLRGDHFFLNTARAALLQTLSHELGRSVAHS